MTKTVLALVLVIVVSAGYINYAKYKTQKHQAEIAELQKQIDDLKKQPNCVKQWNEFVNTIENAGGPVELYRRYHSDTPPAAMFFEDEIVVRLPQTRERTFLIVCSSNP